MHMVLGWPWSARKGESHRGAAVSLPSPRSSGVLFLTLYWRPEHQVADKKAQRVSAATSRLSDFSDPGEAANAFVVPSPGNVSWYKSG